MYYVYGGLGMFNEFIAYAAPAADAAAQTGEVSTTAALAANILPFAVLILFFWLFIIRPQRKREKQTREMLAALKVGDKITTIGGIVGKVARIKDDTVTIETGADKVKIVFERKAIASVEQKISD